MRNDFHGQVHLGKIAAHLRMLRLRGWPHFPIEELELQKIFIDINSFLVDTSSVEKLLFLLPSCREGIAIIAQALFCEDELVQKLAC